MKKVGRPQEAQATSEQGTTPPVQHSRELAAQWRCTCARCMETARELERLHKRSREIDDLGAKIWSEAGEQFKQLRQKYPLRAVQHMMQGVMATVAAQALATGEHNYDAAVRGAEAQYKAHAERQAIRSCKGVAQSAKRRHSENVTRDRRIHDARVAGMAPKQIAGDRKIRGRKKLSASQIRRILALDRP